MRLELKQEHWNIMREHANAHAPLEACGLLAGKNNMVEKIFLIANQLESPVKFRMDPAEQLKAFNSMESDGLDLLAIFHSHPAGPETLSATDIAEANYPVIYIVWSQFGGGWQARGFWIRNGQAAEIQLKITGSE